MPYPIRTLAVFLLTILPFGVGNPKAQSARKKFAIVPFYTAHGACHPAEVKGVAIGAKPPEVLSPSVIIESFSAKEITALRLSWKVYSWDDGRKRGLGPCEVIPGPNVFLSGTTPLIQVGTLSENETCNIKSPYPAASPPTTKTVFIEQPIIAWDEVKSLTSDGTRDTFKENYVAVIYVSEIRFADGAI